MDHFRSHVKIRMPRSENSKADALARLASGIDADGLVSVPVECLNQPSIERNKQILFSEKKNPSRPQKAPEQVHPTRSAPADHTVLVVLGPLGRKMVFPQWEADKSTPTDNTVPGVQGPLGRKIEFLQMDADHKKQRADTPDQRPLGQAHPTISKLGKFLQNLPSLRGAPEVQNINV
ncbi:hypothetical protein TIFTF001_047124 [Ficus carica]|uniref:Uncharacterized protein n=1 Tax=Ficus carica TaxID=3494 RepID=A0AA87Z280_FICCA|nr:hypothetical protein TIFTF001_047124 [Ficus carica]